MKGKNPTHTYKPQNKKKTTPSDANTITDYLPPADQCPASLWLRAKGEMEKVLALCQQ